MNSVPMDNERHLDAFLSVDGITSTAVDVVFAARKLRQGEAIDAEEIRALERARELLTGVADFGATGAGRHLLLPEEGAVEALETVHSHAPQGETYGWARELAGTVTRVLSDAPEQGDNERLSELRTLFSSLAERAVARANSTSAKRGDLPRGLGLG